MLTSCKSPRRLTSARLAPPIAFGVVGVAALLQAAPAAAQPLFENGPKQSVRRDVSIDLSARAEYDTNSGRGNDTVTQLRGLSRDDITYSTNASIDATLPVATQSVFLRGSIGYRWHQKNSNLNREAIDLQAGTGLGLGPCSGSLTGAISRSQVDVEDLQLGVTKDVRTSWSAGVATTCSVGVGFGESLSVQYSRSSDSASQNPDVESVSVQGALAYSNRRLGSVSLTGGYSRTMYNQPPLPFPTPDKFESYTVGLRYERPFGARMVGQASAQYYYVPGTSINPSKSTGWTARVGLSYKVSARMSSSVNIARALSGSNRVDAQYTLNDTIALQVGYRLSNRLRASVSGNYGRRFYKGQTIIRTDAPNRERRWSTGASLSYSLRDNIGISLDARHDVRNADINAFDYTSDRVGVTLSASF